MLITIINRTIELNYLKSDLNHTYDYYQFNINSEIFMRIHVCDLKFFGSSMVTPLAIQGTKIPLVHM